MVHALLLYVAPITCISRSPCLCYYIICFWSYRYLDSEDEGPAGRKQKTYWLQLVMFSPKSVRQLILPRSKFPIFPLVFTSEDLLWETKRCNMSCQGVFWQERSAETLVLLPSYEPPDTWDPLVLNRDWNFASGHCKNDVSFLETLVLFCWYFLISRFLCFCSTKFWWR